MHTYYCNNLIYINLVKGTRKDVCKIKALVHLMRMLSLIHIVIIYTKRNNVLEKYRE